MPIISNGIVRINNRCLEVENETEDDNSSEQSNTKQTKQKDKKEKIASKGNTKGKTVKISGNTQEGVINISDELKEIIKNNCQTSFQFVTMITATVSKMKEQLLKSAEQPI